MREFVVGTGGRSLTPFTTVLPNSEVQDMTSFGVLAARCGPARAPLHVFGAAGGPRYEPRVRPGAEQRAALAAVPWGPAGGSPGTGTGASLADVVRQRGVALFMLGGPGYGMGGPMPGGPMPGGSGSPYPGSQGGGTGGQETERSSGPQRHRGFAQHSVHDRWRGDPRA